MTAREPNFLFQKMLMCLSAMLLIQGLSLYLIHALDLFYLAGAAIALVFFTIGILLIDWEAKRYYRSLKGRPLIHWDDLGIYLIAGSEEDE